MRASRGSMAYLVASLVLLLGAGSCAKKQQGMAATEPGPAATPGSEAEQLNPEKVSPSQAAAAVLKLPQPDRAFIEQASGANAAAVELGKLAMERGSTEQIRRLGGQMVDTHTRLSDDLRIYAAQEGVRLPLPSMTPAQKRLYLELSKQSGADFDKHYLKAIRQVQRETLASFQKEAVDGQLPAFSQFANDSLPVLQQHVRMVRRDINQL